jgi:hypothetical protein
MRHTLTKRWLVGALCLLGGFFPAIIEAHDAKAVAATVQAAKEKPCPLCGQPWRGRVELEMAIPTKLPAPKNHLWIRKLRMALAAGKLAKAQFEAAQKRFGVSSPYLYVLPQTEQHIAWIGRLFSAYGLPAQGKTPSEKAGETSGTLLMALKNGRNTEIDLATHYEWLLKHAEDKVTKRVLNTILTQTNINRALFQNDIRIIEIEGSMVPSLL